MKGVVKIVLVVAFLVFCGTVVAMLPILSHLQYEQFCEIQKALDIDIGEDITSITDKEIALEYYSIMSGKGDLRHNQIHTFSQKAEKLQKNVSSLNNSSVSALNLFDNAKLNQSAVKRLVDSKFLTSKAFYGGIGAKVGETYAVNEMEKDQTTSFSSITGADQLTLAVLDAIDKANRDDCATKVLLGKNFMYLIGMNIKSTLIGTWGTDATWDKIFYKDIKAHEMFTGHRHEARPHTWSDEKRANPSLYHVTADMGSEGCEHSGTLIPTRQTSQFNVSHT